MGCIALEDIEIGTLILKEKFQCIPKIECSDYISDDYLCSLMDSFFSMKKNVQEEFLTLNNKFLDPHSLSQRKDYFIWKRFAELQEEKWISNSQLKFRIDRHFILKLICIYHSNGFSTGYLGGVGYAVGIKSSRFNHSCSPNSESGMTIDEMNVRATSKIKKGEEICTNYFALILAMKNKKERQDCLQKEWQFICSCERCQDEEINKDDETYEKFQKLQEEAQKNVKKAKTTRNNLGGKAFTS